MKIIELKLIEQCSISVCFDETWYEEDIPTLTQLVLNPIEDAVIVERVLGADREYSRFNWLEHQFILHFEHYAQSCWIEDESIENSNIAEFFCQMESFSKLS